MRITTWNVNGIRAAIRKGLSEYLKEIAPDVLLLQEVRALPEQLPEEWRAPEGWHVFWHPAEKKGYSGTAIWSRQPFAVENTGLTHADPDVEGRVVTVRVGELRVSSVYLPSGSSSGDRQAVKDQWLVNFREWTNLQREKGPMIFGGDLNIAHTESDIFYAKSNQKTSGFLPHEREWFTDLIKSGWHDLGREYFGDVQGPYSWWSNRGRARELDRGWRIDYLMANAVVRDRLESVEIHREAGITCSDHAPVTVNLA